jgi:hypothetical protein
VPLHVAVYNNNLRVCKFIHEKGHPLDQRQDNGNTPLHDAASKGNLCVFKYLFGLVDEKNPQGYNGYMPIHQAARKGHFEVFKFIYEKSDNKDPQDNRGWMPIHHAASTGQLEMLKFIHEIGDNLNPLSNDGKTPLTIAASNGHFEVSRFIFGVVKQNLTVAEKAEVIIFFYSKINMINFETMSSFICDIIEMMTSAFSATVRFCLTTPKMNRLTSKCPLLAAIVSGVFPSFERGFKLSPIS